MILKKCTLHKKTSVYGQHIKNENKNIKTLAGSGKFKIVVYLHKKKVKFDSNKDEFLKPF